ncbi:hypothetical protein RUM44_005880 [Polyplax serrata]|uniref:Major facilitator superfamily (MFS) profile domain-containing protein n=1 Tax=Polyplax serrata TaxID=468196 RepID=A0ABR1AYC2_POLSC
MGDDLKVANVPEKADEGVGKQKEPFQEEVGEGDDSLFDQLMEAIGNGGRFQKRFNFLYNFLLVILLTMPYLNIILVMTIPDHWCHIPGLETTNYTLDEWKDKWLPKENNSGKMKYSSCKMFVENVTDETPVDCMYGWDFDRQWYSETVPTQESWVCNREIYVSNTFAAGRIGEIIGTFLFGQLGDMYGRKPVFYISIAVLVIGRTLSVFTSAYYYVFLFSIALGSLASTSVFQSPLVISMEVSDEKTRSYIAFLQCAGWVFGLCILAFVAWVVRDWKLIMLVTTLPNIICFCLYKLLPESPRWLASRGEMEKAVDVLKYIARVNGSKLPKNTYSVMEKIRDKKEKFYGLASLFANWRLGKNTVLMVIAWSVSGLCYYVITLSVTTMSGNPFMNFFWQSLVELPGYVLGKVMSDKIGRRWTHAISYAFGSFFCLAAVVAQTIGADHLILILITLVKLTLTTSFYVVWLRTIEIYPTCVRQTGTSIGGTVSNIIGITGPYIIYLGATIDVRLPNAVLFIMILIGFSCSVFLPETLNKKLPETLEDAKAFGKNQKFWSFSLSK